MVVFAGCNAECASYQSTDFGEACVWCPPPNQPTLEVMGVNGSCVTVQEMASAFPAPVFEVEPDAAACAFQSGKQGVRRLYETSTPPPGASSTLPMFTGQCACPLRYRPPLGKQGIMLEAGNANESIR